MLEKIEVGLEQRSYPIWIGDGILSGIGAALKAVDFPSRVGVVTNPKVGGLYLETVQASLVAEGFSCHVITIPDGEQYKNLQTLETIFDTLIEHNFDRSCGLLALGGGVVGDITGFAAATYLRGVPFAQVPTTLLAQVDSSVGGKTAVNHRLGKNLIGAFYQPRHVHIDVSTLSTLEEREFAAGMAEVVKYGVIRDQRFFTWLEDEAEALRRQDRHVLIEAVKRSCQIKANIVEIDEKERSLRAILNFGHTYGHAVETLSGYGRVKHGEAVAIGMVVAAAISSELDLCQFDDVGRIRKLLTAFDLPVLPPDLDLEDCLQVMGRDKKVQQGVLRLILNRGIGDCLIREVEDPDSLFSGALKKISEQELQG